MIELYHKCDVCKKEHDITLAINSACIIYAVKSDLVQVIFTLQNKGYPYEQSIVIKWICKLDCFTKIFNEVKAKYTDCEISYNFYEIDEDGIHEICKPIDEIFSS